MAEDGKVCSTCRQWRPRDAYNVRARAADGLQSRCRSCCRAWYLEHREEHLANTARRSREVRDEYRRRLLAYLDDHPCVDCGETDVVVLEFDHRDAGSKVREVAKMVNELLAWTTIEAEIAKCDVRCANCHRRGTARRGQQARHLHQQQREVPVAAAARERLGRLLPLSPPASARSAGGC